MAVKSTSTKPRQPCTGPSVWSGSDQADNPDWNIALGDQSLHELSAAISETQNCAIHSLDCSAMQLPTLRRLLATVTNELLHGRGFSVLRGLPVTEWAHAELVRAYWIIGSLIGTPVAQNGHGDLLGHVIDLNEQSDPNVRLYRTSKKLSFHSDSCDFVGLLCLQSAAEGGNSQIASAAEVHNRLLAASPALLETLYGEFHCDRYGEIPAGQLAYYAVRIFNRYADFLTCCGMDPDIRSAQRLPEVPPLTDRQLQALNAMQQAAIDSALSMTLAPGDIQLLHNHVILHARSAYVDHPEIERKRHQLRLWLSARNGRPLPDFLASRWGTVEVGAVRGGIIVPAASQSVSLMPH